MRMRADSRFTSKADTDATTEPKRSMSYAEEYLIDGCMAAKGYTVTW